ncbi:MAG: DUF58 domain-containing protein [Gemmatimonadaceae bacterium]|nr:DUF58 domain-containing protein [Gemmatimonadaceae bacterium]
MSTAHGRADLIDPLTLAQLGTVEVGARWIVDGFMSGLHRSPRKGFSVEFAEHRPYQTGDDLRYLDWKIAARLDRWMVKLNEEQTNLRATIVLDCSRSMDWTGSPARLTKQRYADRLVAALALLLLRQKDAVGLVRFDDTVRSLIPPRARQTHWHRLVQALDEPRAGATTDATGGLLRAATMVGKRGLVVLVSDLLMPPEALDEALRALRTSGHVVTVFQVLDPAEIDLSLAATDVRLDDVESPDSTTITVPDLQGAYRATVDAVRTEWRERCAAQGAMYETVRTDEPFGVPLRRAFAVRERMP